MFMSFAPSWRQHYHASVRIGWTTIASPCRVVLHHAALAMLLACVVSCASPSVVARAQQLVRQHREVEAAAALKTHLAKHPDDLSARRLYVRVLAFGGDLDAARAEVAELERRMPNDPTPWIELGHAFELAHRFEEALAAYDTASEKAPDNPAGPREGGMRAARWGEAEDALPRLEEAVRRGARDAELFHALGLVRVHSADLDGASEAYRQGLAVDPKSTENWLGLATVAVVRGDAAAALTAYDAIAAQRPSFAAAELGRAWALAKLGRRTDAERALDRAMALGAPRANVDAQRTAMKKGGL
jgi:tetratricopeptide (TPR) repeat protein